MDIQREHFKVTHYYSAVIIFEYRFLYASRIAKKMSEMKFGLPQNYGSLHFPQL